MTAEELAADGLELAQGLFEDPPTRSADAALLAEAHRTNGDRAMALSRTPRRLLIYTDAIRELAALEPTVE